MLGIGVVQNTPIFDKALISGVGGAANRELE
jgi:hypothetical protein